ncbi:MAG: HEAT repeat domain-containing protein [Myxococcales bacterium]|nr:HEAT repeat domain-containing protein [Myxococcales bacterium]
MNRPAAAALVLLSVAIALAGCPRSTPAPAAAAPRLVEIKVVDRTAPAEKLTVDTTALGERAAADLRAANALPVVLGAPPVAGIDYRLRVDVRLEVTEVDEKGILRAVVEARLVRIEGRVGESPIVNQAMAERIYQRAEVPDRAAAVRAHVERAVDDVLKGLADQARIHLGGRDDLIAALHAPDSDLRAEAIRVAALRKETAAVPALIELLKCDDARLRDRALGALVELGDRRAVKPITEAARFHDVAELPKVIDAAAALGGDQARAYLDFVATGHPDPEIQALAREALGRLDRRAAPSPASP